MQPKLQRFVTLTRRSVTSRPKASTSIAEKARAGPAKYLMSIDELQHELVALFPHVVLLEGERRGRLHRLARLQAEDAPVRPAGDRARGRIQLPVRLRGGGVGAEMVHTEPLPG